MLKVKVGGGGNNIADMVIKQESTYILFTIKYRNKYSETDVSKIDNTITKQNITDDYKIGLVVKDKEIVIKHKYKKGCNLNVSIWGRFASFFNFANMAKQAIIKIPIPK